MKTFIAGTAPLKNVMSIQGDKPGSEPETQALCQLIHRIQPAWVVSFHDPLACIEDPRHSELGEWLAQAFELPLVTSVGYERLALSAVGVQISQLALHHRRVSAHSSDEASEKYLFAMANLLRWHPKDAIRPLVIQCDFSYLPPARSVRQDRRDLAAAVKRR